MESNNEKRLVISDTVLHPIHLEHPEWHAAVDLDPKRVEASRRLMLEKAETEKTLVMVFYLAFPGLGYVTKSGNAWQREAI